MISLGHRPEIFGSSQAHSFTTACQSRSMMRTLMIQASNSNSNSKNNLATPD